MSDYEIGVYNKHVRETIRSGDDWDEEQSGISKDFENVLYFPIRNASSILEVEERSARSFPPSQGYVIDYIRLVGRTE